MSDFLTPKKKKRLIPFKFLPASWGLRGKSRELAKLEYEYDGVDAKLRLAEIENEGNAQTICKLRIALEHDLIDEHTLETNVADLTLTGLDLTLEKISIDEKHGVITPYDADAARIEASLTQETPEYLTAILENDIKHDKISPYAAALKRAAIQFEEDSVDHQVAVIEAKIDHGRINPHAGEMEILNLRLVEGTTQYELEKLRIDHKYDRITQREYDKGCATIRCEPWIDIVEHGFDLTKGINGVYFEFDWNIYWIDQLKEAGYEGKTESDIIDRWFAAVCRNQVQNTTLDDGPVPFSINIRS